MEAARAAVQKITGNRGHHTTVEEVVNPAITQETIKPHRHEESTQAVDREVHQHHYHTTVQPLQHQDRLPEKHIHNILPTEEREFHHDNPRDTEAKLAAELGHFKDDSNVEQVRHTQARAPTVTGEHVHHHVHETVIPVVHKETIQPEVVHTTLPVHETHHVASEHHGLSALPMKSLSEFTMGGDLFAGGQHSAHEEYDGPPRKYNEKLSTTFKKLGLHPREGLTADNTGSTTNTGVANDVEDGATGTTGDCIGGGFTNTSTTNTANTAKVKSHHYPADPGVSNLGDDLDTKEKDLEHNRMGQNEINGSKHFGYDTMAKNAKNGIVGNKDAGYDKIGKNDVVGSTKTKTKPSLRERLDPRIDANGDGKRGVGS